MVEQLAPDIGFNLHDQSPYYQCGTSGNPATIAFLAPAFDVQKAIDEPRERAMCLIAHMSHTIRSHLGDCVARYDDTYSPRSFGDNIAARKVSTILIESGAARGDTNRQIARAMNVSAIISALEFIQSASVDDKDRATLENYFSIPENVSEALSSLLIRNLSFAGKYRYTAGLSIKQSARYSNSFYVDFIGDLHTQAGLVEHDASDIEYSAGKVYLVDVPQTLDNHSYIKLLKQGFLYFNDPKDLLINKSDYHVQLSEKAFGNENAFVLNQPAYCLFTRIGEPSVIVGAMLNGQLVWFN